MTPSGDVLRLDVDEGRFRRGETIVSLRPKAFAVLRHLYERPGRIVTREELLRAVWPETHVSATVLKVCIREIREAIADEALKPRFLETVPSRGYRWIGALEEDAAVGPGDSLLVGREAELARLVAAHRRARASSRQVVFLTGEPGIGKTALVDSFVSSVASADAAVARGQAMELYGPGEPYLAVLEALDELVHGGDGERVVGHLARHAPTWLAQMPALAGRADLAEIRRRSPGGTQERMLRELCEALEALTREYPLVLVLEDLHWSDLSTMDLLGSLARRRTPARLLLIATYRPVDAIVTDHPVRVVRRELQAQGRAEELALLPLREADVASYLGARFPGHRFPPALPPAIHRATDGNPLFMVDVVSELELRGMIAGGEGAWHLAGDLRTVEATVPESLRELVERWLDRLDEIERRVLETGSVAGDSFLADAIAAALGEPVARIEEVADSLVRCRLVLRASSPRELEPGRSSAAYEFLHGIYRKVLYDRLPATRRKRLHRRIGEAVEALFGDRAPEVAAELATHFAHGGDARRALDYLALAGEAALVRFASHEAIGYFEKALEIVTDAPGAPGGPARELDILLRLGAPLVTARGFASPAVRHLYARAAELCREAQDDARKVPVLVSLFTAHLTAGELAEAQAIAEELDRRARVDRDPLSDAFAGYALGFVTFYRGEVARAAGELERAAASAERASAEARSMLFWLDPAVACRAQLAWALWLRGEADRALSCADEALTLARRGGSPFDLGLALHFLATTHLLRDEPEPAERIGEECLATAEEFGLAYWRGGAKMAWGAAVSRGPRASEGLAAFREGIAEWRAAGMPTGLSLWLAMLAEALVANGEAEAAAGAVSEAFAVAEATGERCWEPELHRVSGEVGLAAGRGEVTSSLRRAAAIARARGSRALELRAQASLERARGRRRAGSLSV